MPLYSPMLLTQYAPKTNSLCFLPCHLVFPMLLTHYAPKTRIWSLTIDSPRFGAKKEIYYSLLLFICHYSLSLFTGTIHCYCSLRKFCLFKGGSPLYLGKCFLCLVQDFFLRESFPLRVFLCENILAYLLKPPTFSTKLVTPKPCNYFQLVITTTVSVQFYFQ